MTGPAIHHRCRNHEAREAVCRCPECGNSFCRECVTEHDSRLLCAACLHRIARLRQDDRATKGRGIRKLAPALMALAGIVLSWVIFFGAGEALLTIAVRAEQTSWQNR